MSDSNTSDGNVNIGRISFGAPAAERDTGGLEKYFVDTESFVRVESGQKSILIGNRGTGKSAILKVLAQRERAKGTLVIELAPEDYSYEMLSDSIAKESTGNWAKQGAYASSWKHLVYLLIMKRITESGTPVKTGDAAKIYSYLRDNHRGFQSNPVSALISYLKRFEAIKLGKFEAAAKSRELESLYRLEDIEPLLSPLQKLCEKRGVLILVDELDRGWDASEDAKCFVSGLFQASLSIMQRLQGVRVVISLRRELYDNIPELYEDAQKVRDIIEVIEWQPEDLREIITERVRNSLHDLVHLPSETIWNLVFGEELDYRQTKSFNYVLDRSLYRPREIIQFCTEIRDRAVKDGSTKIDYKVISRAELTYSEERTKDIAAEYRFQFPGALSVFETFRGMSYNLDRKQIEDHCLRLSLGEVLVSSGAKTWIESNEPDSIIETLWTMGFLRAQAVGGLKAERRSGSSYLGSHQVSKLNLSSIQRFHVHPMFRAYLGLKEGKEKRVNSEVDE